MKLKFIYKIIFAAVALVSVSSCDDFLTQENPNSTVAAEYYTSVARCQSGLTGVYNAFKNQNMYLVSENTLKSDLGVQGGTSVERMTFTNVFHMHSYDDSNSTISNSWAAIFIAIRRVNNLMAGIDEVRPTVTTQALLTSIDQIEAQAYFMRGYFYYMLTMAFRHDLKSDECAPLILEPITTIDDLAQPLATASAIRDQYRKDFLQAIELGLNDEWSDADDQGRVTSGAANALLGMSYLYQATDSYSPYYEYTKGEDDPSPAECYAMARIYFKKIMDSGVYSLATPGSSDPSTSYNFTTDGEFNCESILEVSYTLTDNTNLSGESVLYNTISRVFAGSGVGGYATCIPALWLVNEFMNEVPDEKIDDNWVELYKDEFYGTVDMDGEEIKDVIYSQVDVPCIKEPYTLSSNPGYWVSEAIVHKYASTSAATGVDVYENNIYKRVLVYRKDREVGDSDRVLSITYTSMFPYGSRRVVRSSDEMIVEDETLFKVKVEGDRIYRMRKFSPRTSYSMAINGDIDLNYYGDTSTPQQGGIFKNMMSGVFRKYTNWDICDDESAGAIATSSGANLRLIRLSDIYLMYAEALIEGGENSANLKEALSYVNKVRRRAGTILIGSATQSDDFNATEATFDGDVAYREPYTNGDDDTGCVGPYYQESTGEMSAPELMYHLMWVERPLELCVEGFMTRINDLRRWTWSSVSGMGSKSYNVTGDRFASLSSHKDYTYYFDNPTYLTINANTGAYGTGTTYAFQERYSLYELSNMDDAETLYNDYADAAAVYGHWDWYFPVPNSEKISNPYIN